MNDSFHANPERTEEVGVGGLLPLAGILRDSVPKSKNRLGFS